ncbi:ATP-binding protein [Parasulfuritortus cantonensis]|uniref:ATP-binding protein n=1 Tax=Parasulfuritortus cantonensis TaxID=2528202 RepID=A0A4R1B3Z1_9PROT|nr:ATP-binding protein [Parasulfuritortus cantonensis]TCJ12794.1 ATP-binding protein [Parasulfuritortus cantonensis]
MAKPFEIPLVDVQKRLALDNPWWVAGGTIDSERRDWPRRAYFASFMELVRTVEVARAVVLIGPRRVGKTVMLAQAVQALLDDGVPGTAILYLSLDTPLYSGRSLEGLVRTFMELHRHGSDRRLWVFFDEIQYLKDWEVHLKSLVDTFRSVRFVASGSAAAALRMKSRESGAGRFTDFMLPPLTFAEYLAFAGREDALIVEEPAEAGRAPAYRATSIEALNAEFVNYLNYGGFPEAVMNPAVRANPARFLRQDIVDKVLLKDLPSLYGIGDTQELNRFFNVLAYNTSDELSPEGLAKDTGIGKQKLLDYLEYLEAAFLIKRVHRVDESARRMQRARTFKVYLTNPSIRAALFGYVGAGEPAMGALAETAVWSQWLHSTSMIQSLHYARWRQGRSDLEVDLVSLDIRTQKPRFAVEIKWSDAAYSNWGELRGIREFAARHELSRRPLVTTLTQAGQGRDGTTEIEFMPTSLHCYTIARNLLRVAV